MKLLLAGDVHWSKYSSILRGRGEKYSLRLENCIESVNNVEFTAVVEDVDAIVYMGDFFDMPDLDSEELTALHEIKWCDKDHLFIVGNHEMGINNLSFSSAHLFSMVPNCYVIDKPYTMWPGGASEVCFLPYILEDKRKPLVDYFLENNPQRLILSHNDIAGVWMGGFQSEIGFSVEEIEDNCELFINGHLHNEEIVTDKIIDIGNLTGQNFSEDGTKYKHKLMVVDNDKGFWSWRAIYNSAANYFYKCTSLAELKKLKYTPEKSVVMTTVDVNEIEEAKTLLDGCLASRIIMRGLEKKEDVEHSAKDLTVDHLAKFRSYILETFEDNKILREELSEVTHG